MTVSRFVGWLVVGCIILICLFVWLVGLWLMSWLVVGCASGLVDGQSAGPMAGQLVGRFSGPSGSWEVGCSVFSHSICWSEIPKTYCLLQNNLRQIKMRKKF